MGSNYKINYNVDIVFCIDSTGSMDHIIDIVKNNALNFHDDLMSMMKKKQKTVQKLRVRIVAFKDYLADGEDAMMVTRFFDLPEEKELLRDHVNSITADGGGDPPEDGYEALAYAIKSDWDRSGQKSRHVIALWTDDTAHPLGYGSAAPNYPRGMARNIEELTAWWNDDSIIKQQSKRLLLFAPDTPEWSYISSVWKNCVHSPSRIGEGLREQDYTTILDTIANSI